MDKNPKLDLNPRTDSKFSSWLTMKLLYEQNKISYLKFFKKHV